MRYTYFRVKVLYIFFKNVNEYMNIYYIVIIVISFFTILNCLKQPWLHPLRICMV